MSTQNALSYAELIPDVFEKKIVSKKKLQVKFGADPSASDLHLGHCVVLFQLRQLQEMGHHVQFVIGDFTAKIGDPSGKSETRKPLSDDEIAGHAKTYQDQVFRVLDRDKTTVYYNSEWLGKLSSAELIQLAARYNVARMLERDDFEKRYKAGKSISVHEFLYPLLQGYDSVVLKSDLELGGTDQKFNLLVGRHLQREYGVGVEQAIMTVPILEGTDGVKKMSKSLNNHIGILDAPNDMFGKIMSIPDDVLGTYLRLLTDMTAAEIEARETAMTAGEENPRNIKVQLGQTIVGQFHGDEAAAAAYAHFQTVFAKKDVPDEMPEKSVSGAPKLVDWVVGEGILGSKKEMVRLIQQGAVSIDEAKVEDIQKRLEGTSSQVLKIGKRRFFRLGFG